MRELSKVEIGIINQFKQRGRSLSELLGGIGKELIIKINKEKRSFNILIKNCDDGRLVDSDGLNDFLTPRLIFITTLIKLLGFLEINGYLVTYSWNQADIVKYFGDESLINEINTNETNCIKYVIDDEELTNLIIRFGYSYIQPTESLKLYINSGYKTPEQIRFRKTHRITIFAIILSFLVGISSLWIAISSFKKPITIDEKQFNILTEKLDSINNNEREVHKVFILVKDSIEKKIKL